MLALSLLSAPRLGHYLSHKVAAVTRRLMGVILAAIAVEMMVGSIKAMFALK